MEYSQGKPRKEEGVGQPNSAQNQRGQIVVEYVLLLMIAVMVAALIVNGLFSREDDNPGFIVQQWKRILIEIGQDMADDVDSDTN